MYPYYSMLDEKSQSLYRQIYANACDLYGDFKAVTSDVTPAQVKNAFMAVFNDHPELFYLNTSYSAAFRGNGDCLELKLSFNDLSNDIDNTRSAFEAAAADISSSGTPYETEKAVHNALAGKDVYSLAAPYNQSAYSSLVSGPTVCAGYSRAMQYVMQLAGIPCYYCTGYAGENHAWNIICLDGDYYNVDVTWDDTDSSPEYTYDWFNKTDDDYGTTHIRRDLSVYLPPCNGTKYRNLEENPEGGLAETPTETSPDDSTIMPDNDISADNPTVMIGQPSDKELRSLSDAGLSENEVIRDIDAYYSKACEQITALGKGGHIYRLVVDNEELCNEIAAAYNNKQADEYVLKPAMVSTGSSSIDMVIYPEKLSDGRYLLEHRYNLN